MDDDLAAALRPVFLEPRDNYWKIHRPDHRSMVDQQSNHLAPLATAEQLENAILCADCFTEASR
ncbi:MAG: hypothetical protein ABEJ30_05760 [Halorientalis sp.]